MVCDCISIKLLLKKHTTLVSELSLQLGLSYLEGEA